MEENYDFDVTKAVKLFDFLLDKGQIKLPDDYVKPTAKQLKNKKFCKYHNVTSHGTNECRVFRAHIQKAIQRGLLKFDTGKKMSVDQNPFPKGQHMVDVVQPKGKVRVLTSANAKKATTVDPEMQISTKEFEMIKKKRKEDKSQCEQEGASKVAIVKPRVTSRILLNRWQRQKEKDRQRWLKEEEDACH